MHHLRVRLRVAEDGTVTWVVQILLGHADISTTAVQSWGRRQR